MGKYLLCTTFCKTTEYQLFVFGSTIMPSTWPTLKLFPNTLTDPGPT